MIIKVIVCIGLILLTAIWIKLVSCDKDFMINGKMLQFTNMDMLNIVAYLFFAIFIIIKSSMFSAIFATISLSYLIIAAITDKKTKLVYDLPFYIFGVVAVIFETMLQEKFSASVLWIYIFAQILATFKLYGKGDRAMTVVCGTIYYFNNFAAGSIEALLVTCIMILVAEITFYIKAVKERNLDGPFKLKESRPLGPDLCFATFIILTGVNFA